MKIEKGQPGYIRAQKTKYLLYAVFEFGIVIAIFILGYMQTGSRLNLFTVIAVVGCLPASKMLVEFITMCPHKSIPPEKLKEIEESSPLLTHLYDLILTSTEKVMPVSAIVISGHIVCGYTESEKTDEVKCARYIKDMLRNNHHDKMTVKIFKDYGAFLARAEGMNSIADVEKPDTRRKEREVKKLILTVSM